MRVFLSALIILVLVGCNSATDEVTVEETTFDFLADTAQVTVEEVDTIETKEKEVQEIEELNDTNLVRINGDSAVRFGLIYDGESGCVRKGEREFTGIVYRTNNKGVVDCEVEYFEGCPMGVIYFKSNGEADEIWVFGENNRMISFDADSNLIYNDQPLTGYLVFYNIFCLDCDEFTDHYNYDNYNKDSLDKVWDLWDLILWDDEADQGTIYQYKNGKENGFYKSWDNYGHFSTEGYYENGKRHGTFNYSFAGETIESIYDEGKLISSIGGWWGYKTNSINNIYYKSGKLEYSMVGEWGNGEEEDDPPEYVNFTMELFYETGEIKGIYEREITYFDWTVEYDEYDEFKKNNKNNFKIR